MKTQDIYIGAVILAIIAIVGFTVFHSPAQKTGDFVNGSPTIMYQIATSGPETVGTSDTIIDATSTGRTFLKIADNSASSITCNYGKTSTAASGFQVAASSTFEMNQLTEPVYIGAVHCISDTGSAASIYLIANE